ncbi:MAG: thiolase domain-containing protein [Anaerolineae bacterium]|nr:thiolase domain-containing protein [Anaerolineae bacterium]
MREVAIVGVGATPVGEHWQSSLRMLGAEAIQAALQSVQLSTVDAMYVGNAYGSTFSSQAQLGALIADYAGLKGIEAYCVESGDASGAAALRTGYMAIASGLIDTAIVLGVEKSTDAIGSNRVKGRSVSLDADYESVHGATLTALAAMIMRRYMHEYQLGLGVFEGFTINAHRNGNVNESAMFRNLIKPGGYARASMISDPVNLFDGAPDADGAAAVILTTPERAADLTDVPVMIVGSAVGTDSLALQDREDLLYFRAADESAYRAYQQAGVTTAEIDLFELHDAYTIFSALTLEATGFAGRGEGWTLANNAGEALGLKGSIPICTFGGLKSRGNPVGATGVYQALEAYLQLTGRAGKNQVPNAKIAAIQNLGGAASTAITHILKVGG